MAVLDPYYRNFRDLSYLSLPDGRHLKPNLFLRSGKLKKLSKKEIDGLLSLGLATLIDLRTPGEIAKKPDTAIPGVKSLAIPILKEETLGITHERGLKAYNRPPNMPDMYASIVTNEGSVEGLRLAFKEIFDMDREGAILWHCTAGKDRAGIVTALFLKTLGYAQEDIEADYLRSHPRSEKQGRLYRFLVRAFMWDWELGQAVYKAMCADVDYIRAAFAAIDSKWGSFESFVTNQLGISNEQIEALKAKYIE